MIELTLAPGTLFAGRPTQLTVTARNTGAGACTTLRMRLELPPSVLPVGGSTRFMVPRLDPGLPYEHRFTVEAQRPGRFRVGVANFSYGDPAGWSRQITDASWTLQVHPAEEASEPTEQQGPENTRRVRRGKVFINYRRDDAQELADRLYENLRREFGPDRVFLDRQGRELGRDFRDRINAEVRSSTVMVVLIGPRWNPLVVPENNHRLEYDDDPVRSEIRVGIQHGLWIIPVLFRGTKMPPARALPEDIRQVAYFDAQEMHNTRVDADTFELLTQLRRHIK